MMMKPIITYLKIEIEGEIFWVYIRITIRIVCSPLKYRFYSQESNQSSRVLNALVLDSSNVKRFLFDINIEFVREDRRMDDWNAYW